MERAIGLGLETHELTSKALVKKLKVVLIVYTLLLSVAAVFAEESTLHPWGQQGYSSNCSEIPPGRFIVRGEEEKQKLKPWLAELVKQIKNTSNESLAKVATDAEIVTELKLKQDGFYEVTVRRSTASKADLKLFVDAITKAAPIRYAPPFRSAFVYPLLVTYDRGALGAYFSKEPRR